MVQTARIARYELLAARRRGARLHWHPLDPAWSPRQTMAPLYRDEAEATGLTMWRNRLT
jgi:hypothetical protein